MYVASYMMKSEKSMGDLLKQVSDESNGQEIRAQLRLLGSVFLTHREVSAQESVYRILSLPLKQLSRKVVFINTDPKHERVVFLKHPATLEGMEDNDENIFQISLIDRYTSRPPNLNSMCLAEFAANYTVRSTEDEDKVSGDAIPKHDSQESGASSRIQLAAGLGSMYKRNREAVIRFHKFNMTREPSKVYRSKLIYVPWRNEDTDILAGYNSYRERYHALSNDILANERRYSQNADVIDEALDELSQYGPPQHAWDLIAPRTEEDQISDRALGYEVQRTIEQEDVHASAQLFQREPHAPLLQRFTREAGRQLFTPEEYRRRLRQLNTKQKEVVTFNRKWCKQAVISLRIGQPPTPYRLFLSGPDGVGKSHVLSLIHHDTVQLLRLSGQIQPEDVTVLLTAPTGVAAFNIDSMTLHSALLLGTSFSTDRPLSQERLSTLRTRLSKLQLLIIDEMSMVGCNMFLQIHKRLQQLKGTDGDHTFGNVNILAVGDLYQLQPVAQPYVFAQVADAYACLHRTGSLWMDEFRLFELDEIMRQKDDQPFAKLLSRVRIATCNSGDITLLESREISEDNPSYPTRCLHVYRLNRDVDQRNITMLNALAPENEHVSITAIDQTKDTHTTHLTIKMPPSKAKTGGLVGELTLAVGAEVMLTINLDVNDGLVNGA